jgi:hypothetical protein
MKILGVQHRRVSYSCRRRNALLAGAVLRPALPLLLFRPNIMRFGGTGLRLLRTTVLFALFWTLPDYAANGVETESELTTFFKNAVRSPLDVEHFTAAQRTLRERTLPPQIRARVQSLTNQPVQTFEGARAGTNFYLRRLTSLGSPGSMAIGRNGREMYHVNANTLTYTHDANTEANPLLISELGFRSVVEQFLNMGLAEIRQGSVVWDGLQFSAFEADGTPIYGHLDLQDGIPSRLEIRTKKDAPPKKAFSYAYPEPPLALSGFPSTIVIWSVFQDGLHPWSELRLLNIKLSDSRLADNFFAKSRFVEKNIVYTNIINSDGLFNVTRSGLVKAPIQPEMPGPKSQFYRRITMWCLAAIALGLPAVFWFMRKFENMQSNNRRKST